jgi:uncharacterized protein YndB with AHSA1/START domain
MPENLVATAETIIDAPVHQVWAALTDPDTIRRYMFGTTVVTDWRRGSPITWAGVWEGKPYQDKGVILAIEPNQRLQVTHYSPLSGAPDVPASYHTLTYALDPHGDHTHISLSQDNNGTEKARAHSEKMWTSMLAEMKNVIESRSAARARL